MHKVLTSGLICCALALTPLLQADPAPQASTMVASRTTSEEARARLLMLLSGEWVSRGLYVATKLEIATHLLEGPKSVEQLAELTESDPDSLSRLLHMLAGFGLFAETAPDTFANTAMSQLLAKGHPESLHALSTFYGEEIHQAWDQLLPSIQAGTPAFQLAFEQPVFSYFKDNPSRGALFQAAMKEKSMAVIRSALSSYDFGRLGSVCDVGGGQGQFMRALLQLYPTLTGTIFELPEVIAGIRQASPELEGPRLALCAGDFFVSIPAGAEAYLLKSVLHDWNDQQSQQILKNCSEAMGPDGRLLIVEVVLQPQDQSIYANCMDLLMLAITGGKERSLDAFRQMLNSSGLVLERVYSTATEFSILEVRKVAASGS